MVGPFSSVIQHGPRDVQPRSHSEICPGDRSDFLRGMMPLLHRVLGFDCDYKHPLSDAFSSRIEYLWAKRVTTPSIDTIEGIRDHYLDCRICESEVKTWHGWWDIPLSDSPPIASLLCSSRTKPLTDCSARYFPFRKVALFLRDIKILRCMSTIRLM